jgi:hypothetical protein
MAKKLIEVPNATQFERVYKDEDCTTIWKYDLTKFTNGPISVEFKWTAEYLKQNKSPKKPKADGKLGDLHDAFAKLDAKRKKKKATKQSPKSEKSQSVKLKTDDKEYW